MLSRSELHDCSEERHGVKEIGNIEGKRSDKFGSPVLELEITFQEIIEPHLKGFLGEIGNLFPTGGDFVKSQTLGKCFHSVGDIQSSGKSESKFFKGELNDAE